MKQYRLFLLTFLVSVAGNIHSQVVIGDTRAGEPEKGVLLELRPNDKSGGLLMPRVALTLDTDWAPIKGSPANGMTVYNTANTLKGKGLYVWTDGRWSPVAVPPCNSAPETPVLHVNGPFADQIERYVPFLVYVESPDPDALYEWILPDELTGSSESDIITIVGIVSGEYAIRVKAINDCGVSNEASYAVTIGEPASVDHSGNVEIQGVNCYDIAQTETTDCGSLNDRKPAFDTAGEQIRNYTLSIQNNNIKNLKAGWGDDIDGIIKSVTIPVLSDFVQNQYNISVEFADNINDIILNNGRPSTARLYVTYQDGGINKVVSFKIVVQDCSCCPGSNARIVQNAVYAGADIIEIENTMHPDSVLKVFTKVPNAALCIWNINQGISLTQGSNTWNDANAYCFDGMSAYGDGWRLPNIAEMYYQLHREFIQNEGPSSSWNVGRSRFFSSTARKSDPNVVVYTITSNSSSNPGIDLYSGTVKRDLRAKLNFRCVKTISD
jgi:hypothetical protein